MTRAKRPKPLRQIHSDPTRAHGLHMHHFYYFDTATDLHLRNIKRRQDDLMHTITRVGVIHENGPVPGQAACSLSISPVRNGTGTVSIVCVLLHFLGEVQSFRV